MMNDKIFVFPNLYIFVGVARAQNFSNLYA